MDSQKTKAKIRWDYRKKRVEMVSEGHAAAGGNVCALCEVCVSHIEIHISGRALE